MTAATRYAFFAAIAFATLTALSGDAWSQAQEFQRQTDRAHALRSAAQRLVAARPLQAAVDTLVNDPALGFRFLAVRDAGGRVLATRGRFELRQWPGVPAAVAQQIRELLYALTSTHGYLRLNGATELEYALGAPESRERTDEAVARLSKFGALGLFCGLTGLLAVFYLVRLRNRDAAPVRRRELRPVVAARDEALDLLAAAGVGMLRLDRQGRVLALNAMVERWTGWTAQNALDQQVFSVLRLRDHDTQPLDAVLAAAWRAGAKTPVQMEGWLHPRQGERLRVDVSAAALRDAGGVIGAVLVLREAGRQQAQVERLTQAARLPLSLMDRLDEVVLHTDAAGVIRYANQRVRELLGYAPEALPGASIGKLLPVPFLNQPQLKLGDYVARAGELPAVTGWHQDGHPVAVDLLVEPLPGDEGLVVMLRPRKTA